MASTTVSTDNSTDWDSDEESAESRAPRAIFLLLFMLVTISGDSLLLCALTSGLSRPRIVQNILIGNLVIVGLIDCAVNMGLVLVAVTHQDWDYGTVLCRLHFCVMNLVAVQTSLSLLAFGLDRLLTLKFSCRYETWLSSCRLAAPIIYGWVQSVAFSVVFLTDAAPSTFRPKLHVCTVTSDTSLSFVCLNLIVSFLVPIMATVSLHIVHARLACQARDFKRGQDVGTTYTQMTKEEMLNTPRPMKSLHSTYLSPLLLAAWLFLVLPYVVTTYIKQYSHASDLDSDSVISYPWVLDSTFLWTRFLNTALFPGIVFACRKDLWQHVKDLILCRRNNAIEDIKVVGLEPSSPEISPPDNSIQQKEELSEKEDTKDKYRSREASSPSVPNNNGFAVPVLFATSTGICIEDASEDMPSHSGNNSESSYSSYHGLLQLRGKTLDVCYPAYDPSNDLAVETSDYDSTCEVEDLFSTSHPISTKRIQWSDYRQTRSQSVPNMASTVTSNSLCGNRALSGTSAADSGLDLSRTHSSFTLVSSKESTTKENGGILVSTICSAASPITTTNIFHTNDGIKKRPSNAIEFTEVSAEYNTRTRESISEDNSDNHIMPELLNTIISHRKSLDTTDRDKVSRKSAQRRQNSYSKRSWNIEVSTTNCDSNEQNKMTTATNFPANEDGKEETDFDL